MLLPAVYELVTGSPDLFASADPVGPVDGEDVDHVDEIPKDQQVKVMHRVWIIQVCFLL